MDRRSWRVRQLTKLLGMPELDTEHLPIHVVHALKERMPKVKNLGALLLYGSVVRGEAGPKSDIDVMAIPLKREALEEFETQVREILDRVEVEFDIRGSFSLYIFRGDEDPHFLWRTVRDGGVIYSHPSMFIRDLEDLSPQALISYTYSHLNDTNKKRLQRFLFSSKKGIEINKKNRLEYVAPGVLLLDVRRADRLRSFMDELGVKYSFIRIWR